MIGLDYPAWIAFAHLRPLDAGTADLLSACLPEIEGAVIRGLRTESDD